jgi:hypothetical protein
LLGVLLRPSFLESLRLTTPIYYFGTNPSNPEGVLQARLVRLLAQILWASPPQIFYIKFDFGYCFGLVVATMFGTVLLALLHVALALADFFSEPLVGS